MRAIKNKASKGKLVDMTNTRWRWVLFNIAALVIAMLLAVGFVRGLLSPRGLAVALVIWGGAAGTGAVLIIKSSARMLALRIGSPTSSNPEMRKLLLRGIRRAKTTIAVLALALFLALAQARDFPILALLVGGTLNLLTIAYEVRRIIRLKKILNQNPPMAH